MLTETNSNVAEVESVRDSVITEDFPIRCAGCMRFLGNLYITTSVSEDVRGRMKKENLKISNLIPRLEVKVGCEIKCNRCKGMEARIEVV